MKSFLSLLLVLYFLFSWTGGGEGRKKGSSNKGNCDVCKDFVKNFENVRGAKKGRRRFFFVSLRVSKILKRIRLLEETQVGRNKIKRFIRKGIDTNNIR